MKQPFLSPHPQRQRTNASIGGTIVLIILLMTLGAPVLGPFDPLEMNPEQRLLPPSVDHWLGTDPFGRDLYSRILWGGRRTLGVAGVAVVITVGGGLLLGMVAGYYRGKLDELIMRVVDVMLAFPGMLLILGLVAIMEPGARTLALAVGLAGVPVFARVVRSAVLSVREERYIEAAQAVGCSNIRIFIRHIFPNILSSVIAFSTIQFGWSILNVSAMSFLGLGESPSLAEWGNMLNLGRSFLRDAPWTSAFPGLAIALTVFGVNLLGDALQDLSDPTRAM